MEPTTVAAELVGDRFPSASSAFLGGSVLTDRCTPTSDLDIVVVLPDLATPFRETTTAGGRVAELFVHDIESLHQFWSKDVAALRPALVRMCADGVVLVPSDEANQLHEEARALLAAGPPPLSDAEWRRRRYGLTDLLDDLAGPADSREVPFIASQIVVSVAEMALLSGGRWLGSGKWLSRELDGLEPKLLDQLITAHREAICGDVGPLLLVAASVLDRAGGRLMSGYKATAGQSS